MTFKESPLKPKMTHEIKVIEGVSMASIGSNINYQERDDLLLITFSKGTTTAGVFTKSSTSSAAVAWSKKNIRSADARAIIINAGNANVFTGKAGFDAVKKIASTTASSLNISKKEVLIAQTGVIGEPLDYIKIIKCISNLTKTQKDDHWLAGAKAIMTTDTFPKHYSLSFKVGNKKVNITGIAKGSGMIAPNMATMLSFISTDLNISKNILQKLLQEISEETFNSITVDGDTSTSDTVILSATGKAENKQVTNQISEEYLSFKTALFSVCKNLALQIIRDGEGASKLITVLVRGTSSKKISKKIALSIANSPLVKTAIAAGDANWGRIIMAIGKTNLKLNLTKLRIIFGNHIIASNGKRDDDYNEEIVSKYMKNDEINILIDFGKKTNQARVWTCDLTHDYIDINGSYRN